MLTPQQRLVWESMLTAEMNARYWARLASRYKSREDWGKIFIALASSGTVASWAIWQDLSLLWKLLSALSAVIAVAMPILDFPSKVETMSDLRGRWTELRSAYELLWAEVSEDDAYKGDNKLSALKSKEATMSKDEASFPYDLELARQCQAEVRQSRGLNENDE